MLLLTLFIGIVLCFALSWVFSFVILPKKPALNTENIAVRLVMGFLIMAVLVAILVTKGNTILILAAPTLLIGGYLNYKKGIFKLSIAFMPKDASAILVFLVTAMAVAYLNIYGVEYLGMKVPVNDQAFYSTTANGLIDKDMESYIAYLEAYYKYKSINIPYHYFEYWLTYTVAYLTHFNTHLILNGIVYGFCIFSSFLVFYNILGIWLTNHAYTAIVCSIVLINIRGIFHYTNLNSENFVQATDSIFFDCNQKLIFILPMFLLGLYFIFKNNVQFGLLLLLILPAMNIVLLPSIIGGITVFLGFQFLSNIRAYKTFFQSHLPIFSAIFLFVIMLKSIGFSSSSSSSLFLFS